MPVQQILLKTVILSSDTTGTYNKYYNIHFYYLTEFYDANVEWSTTGIIGRVKCLKFFGDSVWHCWDATHVDATCVTK